MSNLTKKELKNLVKKANKSIIMETSYNRIRDHIQGGESFTIITSDRHERSSSDNKTMYKQLKQDYKEAGFPFTEIKGGYKETTKYVKDPKTGEEIQVKLDEPVVATENTILVTTHTRPDIERGQEGSGEQLFEFTKQMAQKYSQEAFIFGEQATTKRGQTFKDIKAYSANGGKISEPWAGPWSSIKTVENDEDFWSRVKGKYFQLTEKKKTSQPRSWLEAMKKSKSGYEW